MGYYKYCRKCGEPREWNPDTKQFECPDGHDSGPDTEIDEAEYTYPEPS